MRTNHSTIIALSTIFGHPGGHRGCESSFFELRRFIGKDATRWEGTYWQLIAKFLGQFGLDGLNEVWNRGLRLDTNLSSHI